VFSYLLFNELTETVDLGLKVCWQFLTHRCLCSDREAVALHAAVTPIRPACKVIYIHLLGKYQGVETYMHRYVELLGCYHKPLPAVRCSSTRLWTRSSSSGHLAFGPRLAFFVFFIAVRLTSYRFRLLILLPASCNLQSRIFFLAAFCLCSFFLSCPS